MTSVPFSNFIDFVLASGVNKITQVRHLKQGRDDLSSDFYRPLLEAIVDMHVKGLDTSVLDALAETAIDPRERRIFPKLVNGYKKFLQQGKMTWFEPPIRDYPLGPLGVRVDPEIGLLIDGRPHAIKLYFRGDPLSPQRIVVVNQLLANALSPTWPVTVFSVLDVRRARLYPYRPKSEVGLLLKAEAASLSTLYAGL